MSEDRSRWLEPSPPIHVDGGERQEREPDAEPPAEPEPEPVQAAAPAIRR
jgi:hypothetical protein